MARLTPYAYRSGHSALHRCPGAIKLLGLLGLSASVFFFGPPALAAATAVLAGLSLLAGIRPWELLRGGGVLFCMILLILVSRSVRFDPENPPAFNPEGIKETLLFGWSMLLSFAAGALLFSTTTMTELKDSVGAVERALLRPAVLVLNRCPPGPAWRLARKLKRPRLGLGISLMLAFLPRFFEVWEAASLAWEARGGRRGFRSMAVLIPLVTERMIEIAAETALALEARGLKL